MSARNSWEATFARLAVKTQGARVVHPLGHPSLDAEAVKIGRPKSPIPKAVRDQKAREKVKAKRKAAREAGRVYKTSAGEAMLIQQMKLAGITDWKREYRFDPVRMFRLDFAWPQVKLAVEVEGGSWSGGRHVRGSGFAKDVEKYNLLALAGWALLRYTPEMVKSGIAVQQITDMLVKLQIGVSKGAQDVQDTP